MLQQFTAHSTAATAAKTEVTADIKLEPRLAGLEPTTVCNVGESFCGHTGRNKLW